AWNRGAMIKRCAGRSSGDGIEQANGINEAGVIAYSHASGPAIVAAGENDVHFIVGRGTMIGSVKLAGAVKGQSLRIAESHCVHKRIARERIAGCRTAVKIHAEDLTVHGSDVLR